DALLEAVSGSPVNSEMLTLLEFIEKNPLRSDRKRLDALMLLEAMQEGNPVAKAIGGNTLCSDA
ncbi:MAG: hypothetical protein ACRD6N_18295, partial [Pyrinomonadaceae bacterium]